MTRPSNFLPCLLMGVILLASSLTHAQTVPAPLQPWQEWAAEPFAFRSCTLIPGGSGQSRSDYVCTWPGKLDLSIQDDGGRFSQSWRLEEDGDVVLPGSRAHWPQNVKNGSVLVPVADRDGLPVVRLKKGVHTLSGQWEWDDRPAQLEIPSLSAWWEVSGVPATRRLENRLLFENKQVGATETAVKDVLGARVFRKFIDGQVPQQEIRLLLTAGGNTRELVLRPVADPSQWKPVSLDSPWPVRWQDDGKLRVQVQAGEAMVSLRLRCSEKCTEAFSRPAASAPWPEMEYWALQSNPSFRVVTWSGQPIDPTQAGAPDDWKGLPWVAVAAKGKQEWSVKSRGASDMDGMLTLSRTGWLDFSGKGWWLIDQVQGPTPRSNRLNASGLYEMHAAKSATGQNLLVSESDGKTGVEIREPQLLVSSVLRQDGKSSRVPIAGIEGEFSEVNWNLNLPAGYRVLFAPGADRADRVWWNAWQLTQVLSVALLLILSWRWGRLRAALPAAGLILLAYHTPGVPLWSWGFLLGASLLSVAGLPEKLRRPIAWLRMLLMGLWLLIATYFAIAQVRAALYPDWAQPRTQQQHAQSATFGDAAPSLADRMFNKTVLEGESASMNDGVYETMGGEQAQPRAVAAPTIMPVLAPEEAQMAPAPAPPPPPTAIQETGMIISAGPGLPQWQEAAPVTLHWQGPITSTDTVRLWIVGPFLVGLGRWLSVLLLALVGWSLLRRPVADQPWLPKRLRFPRRAAVALFVSLLSVPALATTVAPPTQETVAPVPQEDWMRRLGDSTYPIPACAPHCTSIAQASLRGEGDRLVVELQAHAQTRAALVLPSDTEQSLVLTEVSVGSQSQPAVLRSGEQSWLMLPQGVSQVRLVYIARTNAGALRFEQIPGRIAMERSGWSFSGISRQRLDTGVLGWNADAASGPKQTASDQKQPELQAPAFVRVSRLLVLAAKWEVHTTVERIAPAKGAFVAPISLLDGEQPRQDLPRNGQNQIEVSFAPGQDTVSWQSDLPSQSPFKLSAPALSGIETWTVQAGSRFHVQATGLPALADNASSFQPLPGETLTLVVSEPNPVQGVAVAVDNATLTQQWGPRGQSLSMQLVVRATTSSDLAIDVPKAVDLISVSRDGAPVAGVKVENGKLVLPASPGIASWALEWRSPQAPGLRIGTEKFAIHAPVANLHLNHVPGEDRWILATPGPGKAPAVAYWPWLLVLLGLAVTISRWKHSPLSALSWILLGIGFSVAAPWKIAIVGGWLVAMKARLDYSRTLHERRWFNLYQAFLVLWTIVAVLTMAWALPQSLLASPDMRIFGQSGATLPWFVDQVAAGQAWASAYVISFPMWVYRALMLAWSLWLALSAIRWLKEALRAWLSDGYQVAKPRKQPPPVPPANTQAE
jgi:hypothetical protein